MKILVCHLLRQDYGLMKTAKPAMTIKLRWAEQGTDNRNKIIRHKKASLKTDGMKRTYQVHRKPTEAIQYALC
jgi:hypothetical protein